MNNLLQACRNEEETYRVIVNVCKQLFPEDAGFVYMVDDSRTMLQEIAYWGTPPPEPRVFDVDDCWALRLGKLHFIEHPNTGLLCSHLGFSPEYGYLCTPISASGGALGMLHLCFGEYSSHYTGDERSCLMEWKQIIAARLAEQYSLSLVNLRLRETLRLESIRDPLTGLYNRRHMEASLAREVLRAKRHSTSVAIIMLDIDHFKPLNDTYGHEAGDVILRELAALVRQSIRGEDIACRYGGEEFLLILPDASLEIAAKRAEELRLRGSDLQVVCQSKILTITISLGVAAFPIHGPDIKDTVKAADTALYQAKKEGRNQVVVAPT
jgi:diguanylate cyclase (GGDEF)-like protein